MSTIIFQGKILNVQGNLPEIGTTATDFTLVKKDLSDISLKDIKGKTIVLNIFPSLDTDVCAASVRKFNKYASGLDNTVVLAVSADLPFAAERFCTIEGVDNVIFSSIFRNPEFAKSYGVLITDEPLKGLLARSVIIINPEGKITYTELVSDISNEPNYEAALDAVKYISSTK